MSVLPLILGVLMLGLAGVAGWVRLAPSDPHLWHVDPAAVSARGAMNSWLVTDAAGADAPAVRLALPPAEAAARLASIVLASPRTTRLAGDDAFATYVTRSALWGFPDYTSVRVAPDGAGSVVSVFARARFGKSDLGVNRARVSGWLRALETATPARL